MTIKTKFEKIKAMPDSDLKLAKLFSLGLQLGMFNKQPIIEEVDRLMKAGYRIRNK